MLKNSLSILALATLITGCSRLEEVGRRPDFQPTTDGNQYFAMSTEGLPVSVEDDGPARAASLWSGGRQSLLGDRRAERRGDILTVVIEIDDEATISNETTRSRSGNESVKVGALLGLPNIADAILPAGATLDPAVDLGGTSTSKGAGDVARNEQITLRVAATVTDVLPNGHLVIAGNQELRVNFELRDLQVAGIVRPEDVTRRNEITYDKIADARIVYGGRGQITDLQQPRYGQQVLDVVMPF